MENSNGLPSASNSEGKGVSSRFHCLFVEDLLAASAFFLPCSWRGGKFEEALRGRLLPAIFAAEER